MSLKARRLAPWLKLKLALESRAQTFVFNKLAATAACVLRRLSDTDRWALHCNAFVMPCIEFLSGFGQIGSACP